MTLRSRIATLLLLSLALTIPAFAAKRRAAAETPLVTVTGTITDETTGAPVAFAEVRNADRTVNSDAQGKYELQVSTNRPTQILVSRSGYETKTLNVTLTGAQTVNAALKSGALVQVKMVDGATYSLDYDVTQFAYSIPFSDYGKSDFANLCKADAAEYRPLKGVIKKITGPAVKGPTSCCSNGQGLKAQLLLKSGETSEVTFADSCFGYDVVLVGRDHTTGAFRYLSWTKVAEAVFP